MNEQEKYDWMVYVCCSTFNHAPYIKEAMNGFTIQETTFPYVCCIVDDASTDGDQEVIKNYLNEHFNLEDKTVLRHEETNDYVLTFARHKTNMNCYFAVLYLKYNHYSIKKSKAPYYSQWREKAKYIAMCEGDDYWTDPLKLQKQVDFLDSHNDYTLCFHSVKEEYSDNHSFDKVRKYIEDRTYSGPEWYRTRPSQTSSFVFRGDIFEKEKYKIIKSLNLPVGDIPLLLTCSYYGKLWGMSDVMSVYRKHSGGWTSQKRDKKSILAIANAHLNYFIFGEDYKKEALRNYEIELVNGFFLLLRQGDFHWEFLQLSMKKSVISTIIYISGNVIGSTKSLIHKLFWWRQS